MSQPFRRQSVLPQIHQFLITSFTCFRLCFGAACPIFAHEVAQILGLGVIGSTDTPPAKNLIEVRAVETPRAFRGVPLSQPDTMSAAASSSSMFKRKKTGGVAKRSGKKARKASYVAKAVPAELKSNIELKAVDKFTTSTAINTTTAAVLLNGMSLGTSSFNRQGRKTKNTRIQLRGALQPLHNPGVAGNDYVRVVIVYDKQCNGATPTWQDIFKDLDASGGSQVNAYSHANLDNSDRFVILRDHKYQVPIPQLTVGGSGALAAETTSMSNESWSIDDYVKCDLPTVYFGTANTGTVTDIASGGIFMICQGMQAAGNELLDLEWMSRVRFIDG